MTFWANAHRLGWASDAQVKRARELGKQIILVEGDRDYFKNLVIKEKWTAEEYKEIVGDEYS